MSAEAALASWTNHDSSGQDGLLFGAFPGAQAHARTPTTSPYHLPGHFSDSPWPPSPFSASSSRSAGSLFAHHQDYAMRGMGAGGFRNDWDMPSSMPMQGNWSGGKETGAFGASYESGANDGGSWFGKEGQKKLQQLGNGNSGQSPRGYFEEELGDPWERDDWKHKETDWDALDVFGFDDFADDHRRDISRKRSRSFSQAYDSPYTSSSFYHLPSPSSLSLKSPRNRGLLKLTRTKDDYRSRPLTWRADYAARPTLLSKLPLVKSPSNVEYLTDPTKRSLHPYLRFSGVFPAISMDLRINPSYLAHSKEARRLNALLSRGGGAAMVHFLHLPHPPELSKVQLLQPACKPPVDMMRLYHPRLPWYVDVVQTGYGGVTVEDVIKQLWRSLQTQIQLEEYWASEMDDLDQKKDGYTYSPWGSSRTHGVGRSFISKAWSERCMLVGLLEGDGVIRADERAAGHYGRRERLAMSEGVRRVDWLGAEGMVRWVGLVRGKNGIWEIKTA